MITPISFIYVECNWGLAETYICEVLSVLRVSGDLGFWLAFVYIIIVTHAFNPETCNESCEIAISFVD